MKKIIITVLSVFLLFGCQGKTNTVESQFLNDFEKAVLNRLNMANNGSSHQEVINSEYPILSKYKDLEFSDAKLKEYCELYLSGLDTQKNAIDSKLEYIEYDIKWQEGAVKRYQAVEKIYKDYGIFKDNKQEIENNYINQLPTQQKIRDAYVEIYKDLNSQIENADLNYNGYALEMPITNHTEYTYDLYLYFTIFDSKKNRIAYDEPYFANVKPDIKNKFEINISIPESSPNGTYDCLFRVNLQNI